MHFIFGTNKEVDNSMTIATHALMVFSYLIVAAGIFVLGPTWFGLSGQTASFLAIIFFFAAWHIQMLLTGHFDRKKIYAEIEELRQSKGNFYSQVNEKSSNVVAELKILQDLLSQLEKRPAMEVSSHNSPEENVEIFIEDASAANAKAKNSRPLSTLEVMNITQDALIENRVDLYMQPIVYQTSRNVVHYECFSRVRSEDGIIIDAERYISFVKDKGLAGTLDNLLFFRLIQIIRKLGVRQPNMKFFCNMSKESLNDKDFFPQFADYISNNSEFAGRIVLEITRADYDQLSKEVIDRLLVLGRKGCVISLDRMNDMEMDFHDLEKHFVRYLKINLDVLLTKYDVNEIPDLVSTLRARQIYLIISKIESEHDSLQASDCEVELVQGYLYGDLKPAQDYFEEL